MPNAVSQSTPDKLREPRLLGQVDPGIPQAFTQAMKALFIAKDYDDPALVRSGLEEVLAALRDATSDSIQQRLGWPVAAREFCQGILEDLKGHPCEDFDEVAKGIEANLEQMLKVLVELRDGPVKLLQDHGYVVEKGDQLERVIEELRELMKGMLENWPWSELRLPPVDREMVARSRAAILRGEGELIGKVHFHF